MKTFCPNCGTENEGMPGGRVTCRACTASFEVPRQTLPPQPAAEDPIATFIRPQSAAPPPPSEVKPPPSFTGGPPPGYVGPPPAGFGGLSSASSTAGELNTLAVVSLVLGIVCCIPFGWLGAIITGVMAKNQIQASNGMQRGHEFAMIGIVLGVASGLLFVMGIFFNVLGAILR